MARMKKRQASGEEQVRRARRSRAQWEQEVNRWRASGQSAQQYATENGLNAGTLAWWASRIDPSKTGRGGQRSAHHRSQLPAFLPLKVTPAVHDGGSLAATAVARQPAQPHSNRRSAGVSLVVGNGRSVQLDVDFDAATLRRVIDVLEGVAAC